MATASRCSENLVTSLLEERSSSTWRSIQVFEKTRLNYQVRGILWMGKGASALNAHS